MSRRAPFVAAVVGALSVVGCHAPGKPPAPEALAPVVARIAVTRSRSDRALPAHELAAVVARGAAQGPDGVFGSVPEALDALLAEWSRTTATYALRVSHLRTGTGGLNGANKLTGAITDDIATDTMAGAGGQDETDTRRDDV